MLKFKMDMSGLEETVRKINNLGGKAGPRVMRKVIRAGASVAIRIARESLPKGQYGTNTLKKSLAVRIVVFRKNSRVLAIVGPQRKYKKDTPLGKRWASKYAHLVHGGRKAYRQAEKMIFYVNKTGKVVSYLRPARLIPGVRARPFLLDAFRGGQSAIIAAMVAKANTEMLKEAQNAAV